LLSLIAPYNQVKLGRLGDMRQIVIVRSSDKSRMMGDYHVRFCEGLGVKFPLATRLTDIRIERSLIRSQAN